MLENLEIDKNSRKCLKSRNQSKIMMKWSERGQDFPKYWKYILHITSDLFFIHTAEGAKADVKTCLTILPISKYSLILILFSLFKSFHGAIPPSLMVLLIWCNSLSGIVKTI